ncbi:MAG: MaoC/PaaZ C-terminal domain-containing protein [Myxococcota bacterium]|nr:MaoC/PaaZ C-terminal domain-containing protein [Myxococcota bacterium]
MTHLRFDAMPPMGAASLRALLARKSNRDVEALPDLQAEVPGVRFEPERLRTFRRLCRAPSSSSLPLTAPHVLAAPLHMTMLAHEAFPMPLLGLVHVDNRIVQRRPVPDDVALDLHCRLGGLSSDDKGQRFELVTEVRLDGELVWEETSGILKRAAKKTGARSPRPPAPKGEDPTPRRSVLWRVPADAGRRYAAVSGDYNPIHITKATARLFGFKRAIVHGMWSLARCVAEMDDELRAMAPAPVTLDVAFKTPVFLPTTVAFHAYGQDEGLRFGLRASDGAKPHLVGRLGPVG